MKNNKILAFVLDLSINGFNIDAKKNKINSQKTLNDVIFNYENYLNKREDNTQMDLNNLINTSNKKTKSIKEKKNIEYYNCLFENIDYYYNLQKNDETFTYENNNSRSYMNKISNSIDSIYDKNFSQMYDNYYKNAVFENNEDKEDKEYYKTDAKQQTVNNRKISKKQVIIDIEINSIKDLLKIIEDYPIKYDVEYNIDIQPIHNIKEPLIKLDRMIGMVDLKENIVDQILYYVQGLHKTKNNSNNNDFMHTVIYGPPGTGKTEVAKIMGEIFSKLGVLKKNKFLKATRSDFVAAYLGQTALKTRDLIKDCLGGVLFIDEAYALGNEEKRDSFAKECIDTLCEALSDHKDELMVIVAGYEKELKECFFNYNQGLESRFTWRFNTNHYKPEELKEIFKNKVEDLEWSFDNDSVLKVEWFEKNEKYFKFYGRDIETLFSKVKICHSRRVFCKNKDTKKKITLEDLEKGLKLFCKNDDISKRMDNDKDNESISKMYL